MELPSLEQFHMYYIDNEHDDENGTDFADKKKTPIIYALYVDDTLVYIGMSMNFWRRLKRHKKETGDTAFTKFSIQEFEHATSGDLRIYEALYIEHYKPMWNRDKGKKLQNGEYPVIFS